MADNADVKISVKNLKKNFGSLEVLKDISLEVTEGEVVVLIGPSGSGKSTLLRCLNQLEKATSGQIVIDGYDVTDKRTDINKVRENIGMVFQHFNLFNHLNVLKNMTLAPVHLKTLSKEEAQNKAVQLLERVGLADKALAYPSQLSGGQKQRVAIAGVVAMEPKCIVLDEPTAMLDPVGRKEVLKTVKKLREEKKVTVILITHYMEEVVDADKIYVMDHGKVVMEGTPGEIFSEVEKLKEYRLDVPQVTILADELRKRGLDIPKGILRREELVSELAKILQKQQG